MEIGLRIEGNRSLFIPPRQKDASMAQVLFTSLLVGKILFSRNKKLQFASLLSISFPLPIHKKIVVLNLKNT